MGVQEAAELLWGYTPVVLLGSWRVWGIPVPRPLLSRSPLPSEPCGFEATYQELASAVRDEYPDIEIESRLGGTGETPQQPRGWGGTPQATPSAVLGVWEGLGWVKPGRMSWGLCPGCCPSAGSVWGAAGAPGGALSAWPAHGGAGDVMRDLRGTQLRASPCVCPQVPSRSRSTGSSSSPSWRTGVFPMRRT